MPRIARRTPAEIRLLAADIRERRPFAGSVRGWLRDNLDLIEALQAGAWQPARVPGTPPEFVQPRRWPTEDIRVALIEGGVQYQNGNLSFHTLNSELRDLRREVALARAVEGGQPDALARYVPRAVAGTRPGRPAGISESGRLDATPPLLVPVEQRAQPERPSAQPQPVSVPPMVPAWKALGDNTQQPSGPSPSEQHAERLRRLIEGDGGGDDGKT